MKWCLAFFVLCFFVQSCKNVNEGIIEERINTAMELEKAQKYKEALAMVETCLAIDSASILARMKRGEINIHLENDSVALKDFYFVVDKDHQNTKANYDLGFTYYLMDRYDSSIKWYSNALKTKGNDSIYLVYEKNALTNRALRYDVEVNDIRYHRALSYYYAKDYNNSQKDFLFCISEKYKLGDAYLYLGVMYIENKFNADGCEYLNLAFANGNNNAKEYIDRHCR